MSEAIELLPCPFCGGEAKHKHTTGQAGHEMQYAVIVSCQNDECSATIFGEAHTVYDAMLHPERVTEMEQQPIIAWNRRAAIAKAKGQP